MAKQLVASIQIIKKVWERIAPLRLADTSWDNVGIMVEAPYPDHAKRQVLLTIDLTTAVCNEALALPSCSVIVSYHPPIFRGLKSLSLTDPLQASLLRLSAKGISVFSPHTSLDATPNGINKWLAKPFEEFTTSSKPIADSPSLEGFEEAGAGKILKLKYKITVLEAVKLVKEHLKLSHVQMATPAEESKINTIALCAGSGSSIFKGVEADLYLTGEMSHHEVLATVAKGSSVILCNHTNTERGYLSDVLQDWLKEEMDKEEEGEWEVLVSKEDKDPLRTV